MASFEDAYLVIVLKRAIGNAKYLPFVEVFPDMKVFGRSGELGSVFEIYNNHFSGTIK